MIASDEVRMRRRYFRTSTPTFVYGSVTFAIVGQVFMALMDVPWRCIIDQLIYHVGGVSAGNVRLALYREGPTVDRPDGGELVVESGSVAQLVASYIQAVSIPDTLLIPGRYYLAIMCSNLAGTLYRHTDLNPASIYGRNFANGAGYGVFDDPCPVTAATLRIPLGACRIARNLP